MRFMSSNFNKSELAQIAGQVLAWRDSLPVEFGHVFNRAVATAALLDANVNGYRLTLVNIIRAEPVGTSERDVDVYLEQADWNALGDLLRAVPPVTVFRREAKQLYRILLTPIVWEGTECEAETGDAIAYFVSIHDDVLRGMRLAGAVVSES